MNHLLLAISGIGLAMLTHPAKARWNDDSLCRRDEVVQAVNRRIKQQNFYARSDQFSVREWSGGETNVVRCSVLVHVRNSYQVRNRQVIYESCDELPYVVRIAANRFTVLFEPALNAPCRE